MRLHRFYISEKISSKKELIVDYVELINQITRVFRLKVGDRVVLFDGSGNDFECEILDVPVDFAHGKQAQRAELIRFVINEVRPSRYMPSRKVVLYQAIIKKDKFEWVVEKATELGVTDIVPVLAERSEKKSLDQKRLQKIAIEASEQCGRGDVPVIHSARRGLVEVFAESIAEDGLESTDSIAFHIDGVARLFTQSEVDGNLSDQSMAVFIGPEGGWSPTELEMFHNQKIDICSLGKQVLRAETAAIVALSKVLM